MEQDELRNRLARLAAYRASATPGAAVLIPIVSEAEGPAVVLEVRAFDLEIQPGDVCLPGGHVEEGETHAGAVIRETCEELLVEESQIELLADLGNMAGPGGRPLQVFVGFLHNYQGSFSAAEVDRTFSLPLSWLVSHEPTLFDVKLVPQFPNDFPWERIHGGRAYPWRSQHNLVPFYLETDPLVWGATARVLWRFSQMVSSLLALPTEAVPE